MTDSMNISYIRISRSMARMVSENSELLVIVKEIDVDEIHMIITNGVLYSVISQTFIGLTSQQMIKQKFF